jgi:hypothetical protein
MFIRKSDYISIGISAKALSTLGTDKDGFLQHPLEGFVGTGGETTLADLIAEALKVETYTKIDENQYLSPEIINWCVTHQVQNHVWVSNVEI